MFFQDISPGDQWQPEPAARYNAVNRMLCEYPEQKISGYFRASPGMVIVDFMNGSTETIPAYTAVRIMANLPPQSSEELDGRWEGFCIVCGAPAYNEDEPWGIALDDVEPQEYGRMVLSGAVPAIFTGYGRKVTPTQNGLVAGDAGSAWVVAKPVESYPEYESFPGVILLGGGSGSVDNYYGPFKLRAKSETEVEVIDGAMEDAAYCGFSDVPGLGEVPRLTLTLPVGKNPVYIYFPYSESDGYSAELGTTVPDGVMLYRFLGYFHKGSVTQAYKDSGTMIFGDQWYLYVREIM